jgi:hypothetical protein
MAAVTTMQAAATAARNVYVFRCFLRALIVTITARADRKQIDPIQVWIDAEAISIAPKE